MRHPGFHRYVERIIDTPERTYLHLHQQRFVQGKKMLGYVSKHPVLSENRSTIFYFDHNTGGETPEIKSLASLYPEMPLAVRYASYNPAGKYLAVACENNELWIVPDNGAPYPIHGLDTYNYPGLNHINSLEFGRDDNLIWIATTYGYAVADPGKRIITDIKRTDTSVTWIAPVGETTVAFADSTAFTVNARPYSEIAELLPLKVKAPAGADLSHAMEGETLIIPEALMPLTSDAFAFLAPRSGGRSGRALCTATRRNGSWTVTQIADDDFRTNAANESLNSSVYVTAIPNRDGYYVAANNFSYQLLSGVDTDPENDDPVATFNPRFLRRQNKVSDNWRHSGSWDLSRFVFFQNFYGWYTRTAIDSQWGERSPYLHFNGPATALAQHMTWHPDYGLLAVNPCRSNLIEATDLRTPLLVSAFRDNRWTDLSPLLHTADEKVIANLNGNPSLFYPVTDPNGIAIDPLDPAHAFSGSIISGWTRYNLADPSELPLHVGNERDFCRDYDGFYAIYPQPSEWTSMCAFSAPGFDADNRLWMLTTNTDLKIDGGEAAQLHYYTAEDLVAIRNANTDPEAFRPTRTLTVALPKAVKQTREMLPLRHPANRNLLVIASGGFRHPIAILDHNGTPENPDDDRIALLSMIYDREGHHCTINDVTSLWENPDTGELWITSSSGVVGVTPTAAFDDPAHVRSIDYDLQSLQVNAICADPLGRLWLATDRGGVLVTDTAQSVIEHHITASLSPLPADRVIGMIYNPERRSIMMSTDQGLAEFFPDDLAPGAPAAGVSVSPSTVTPSYPGAVKFAGLTPGASVTLSGPDGTAAATGTVGADGSWQWEGRAGDGRRSPHGVYRLYLAPESGEPQELATVRII